MYADDGLIVSKDDREDVEVDYWFETLGKLGVTVDPNKSGLVKNNFKFLGVEFDLVKQEVKYKESTFS
jgi:hypothetical protein